MIHYGDVVVDIVTDIITGIMTEPTRYALIIAFITSVILFLLNEWAKRRYLVAEKLYSLRLERFESLLQELYLYVTIYEYMIMVLKIQIVDVTTETQAQIVNVNTYLEKLFSKTIINITEVWEANSPEDLTLQKLKLMNFLNMEGLIIFKNVQYKAAALHLIMPDKNIQAKANDIATNIYNSIQDKNTDDSEKIQKDLSDLVDSMRTYLPSLSLID